jgi:integrase
MRGRTGLLACIQRLLQSKRDENLSPRYTDSLDRYLTQFSAAKGVNREISSFPREELRDWISKYPNPDTRKTWRTRLSALFSFAHQEELIPANPFDKIPTVKDGADKEIKILPPDDVERLLLTCPPSCRAYFILSVFGALRPEELTSPGSKKRKVPAKRMKWDAVNFETGTVEAIGKNRRRIVPLQPRALQLLRQIPNRTGFLAPSHSVIARWKKKVRIQLGLARFPQDLFRHVGASYLAALLGDLEKVATIMGNSKKVLVRHYVAPVSKSDADRFWQIGEHAPHPVRSEPIDARQPELIFTACTSPESPQNDQKQLPLGL